jgi:hypothetical protein
MRLLSGFQFRRSARVSWEDVSCLNVSLMTSLRIATLALMLAVMANVALSQSPPAAPSFLVKLKHYEIDLPATASTTCVVVLPDGRAFMEQSSSIQLASRPRVYETSLKNEEMQSLSTILDAADLRASRVFENKSPAMAHGEGMSVIIPRRDGIQGLAAFNTDTRPLPPAIVPIRDWLVHFVKNVKDQRVAPLKNASALTPAVCEVAGKHAEQSPLFQMRSR